MSSRLDFDWGQDVSCYVAYGAMASKAYVKHFDINGVSIVDLLPRSYASRCGFREVVVGGSVGVAPHAVVSNVYITFDADKNEYDITINVTVFEGDSHESRPDKIWLENREKGYVSLYAYLSNNQWTEVAYLGNSIELTKASGNQYATMYYAWFTVNAPDMGETLFYVVTADTVTYSRSWSGATQFSIPYPTTWTYSVENETNKIDLYTAVWPNCPSNTGCSKINGIRLSHVKNANEVLVPQQPREGAMVYYPATVDKPLFVAGGTYRTVLNDVSRYITSSMVVPRIVVNLGNGRTPPFQSSRFPVVHLDDLLGIMTSNDYEDVTRLDYKYGNDYYVIQFLIPGRSGTVDNSFAMSNMRLVSTDELVAEVVKRVGKLTSMVESDYPLVFRFVPGYEALVIKSKDELNQRNIKIDVLVNARPPSLFYYRIDTSAELVIGSNANNPTRTVPVTATMFPGEDRVSQYPSGSVIGTVGGTVTAPVVDGNTLLDIYIRKGSAVSGPVVPMMFMRLVETSHTAFTFEVAVNQAMNEMLNYLTRFSSFVVKLEGKSGCVVKHSINYRQPTITTIDVGLSPCSANDTFNVYLVAVDLNGNEFGEPLLLYRDVRPGLPRLGLEVQYIDVKKG